MADDVFSGLPIEGEGTPQHVENVDVSKNLDEVLDRNFLVYRMRASSLFAAEFAEGSGSKKEVQKKWLT